MAKSKSTMFFCKECGYESAKWLGQCPGCKEWNSFVEQPAERKSFSAGISINRNIEPVTFSEISLDTEERIHTNINELDRVLGGGIVQGELVLVGGDPGIGKSTLLLQMCRNLVNTCDRNVLYISGEESQKQIKIRALRIGEINDNLKLLCDTNLNTISSVIQKESPDVVIIDSIQTMVCENVSASAGSVSQVKESTNLLLRLSKELNIAIFIVGHVTKEGVVAGPRVLEHMVDTVLYFEGDRHASYRVLRAVKNRFGSTDEIGVFEMMEKGLCEVLNPSEYMLKGRPEDASGSVTTCTIEGTRPILLEIQALMCKTNFGIPRRTAVGTDLNRVNLLMAVLEKRIGYHLSECDAYVNIAGGIKSSEPALDLGMVLAIVSSYKEFIIPSDTIAFGEIGLSGEVRAVSYASQRIQEASKMGFKRCLIPCACVDKVKNINSIEVIGVKDVAEAIRKLNKS